VVETVKSQQQLAISPPVTIDDKLRQVPGFSLFRRSGSQTANPTTQGVSLRGLGASGASRSLVLEDGVPINDPFGAWVYWSRVPVASIDTVDLIEGGASDLYGSNALGGVINLRTQQPLETAFLGETSFGSSSTPFGSGSLLLRDGHWGGSIAAEGFDTNGYIPVPADQRGSVDIAASSRHQSGEISLRRTLSNDGQAFLRGNLYGETRANGTVLQTNNTTLRQLATGLDRSTAIGMLSLRVYGGTQTLHQTFSAISQDRNTETLTTDQRVPVSQYGFTAQISKTIASRHLLTVGVDGRDVTGDTNELQFVAGNPSAIFIAGGRQQSYGIFAEDVFQITPRWIFAGSLRGDIWRNIDASSRRTPFSGAPTRSFFANRSESAVSPRLGITRIVNSRWSLYASAYRAFRAPTLNELYRPFRVGNVLTQANADLKAEHFTGGEFGTVVELSQSVRLRGTAFFGQLEDSVGNITLSSAPTLITRQRQNLGTIRTRGFAIQGETHITREFTLSAGYLFNDAVITAFRNDPTLIGLRTPQVPRNSFTFHATYQPHAWVISVQGRAVGDEFDDDRNQFLLGSYFNLGLYVSRTLRQGLDLFGGADNLLNSRYDIARTPVPSVAAPIGVRVGMRIQLSELHRHK
jgi:outer membrane receptor protein involved in Fe transport